MKAVSSHSIASATSITSLQEQSNRSFLGRSREAGIASRITNSNHAQENTPPVAPVVLVGSKNNHLNKKTSNDSTDSNSAPLKNFILNCVRSLEGRNAESSLQEIALHSILCQDKRLASEALSQWARAASVGENRIGAVSQIERCRASSRSCKMLSLAGLGLRSLPPILPLDIHDLVLDNNNLEYLPDYLFKKMDLSLFHASHNALKKLPDLSRQRKLLYFRADHNKLTEVVTLPPNAKFIWLQHNELKEAPPLGSIKKVDFFDLQHNLLTEVPAQWAQLGGSLDISHNRLTSVPDEFFTSRSPDSLFRVKLSNNPCYDHVQSQINALRNSST